MNQEVLAYNPNPFSYSGKLGRLGYFIQNSLLMFFAFRYFYSPYLYDTVLGLQHNPLLAGQFHLLKSIPQFHTLMAELKELAHPTPSTLAIKYLFLIPLRIVDIKRLRDILNRNLSFLETTIVFIFFSLPFVDLISTLFLVIKKGSSRLVVAQKR